jgi:hypothetical protein
MIEERGVGASLHINNVKIRRANSTRCHYTGSVRGSDYSEAGDKHTLHKNSTLEPRNRLLINHSICHFIFNPEQRRVFQLVFLYK